ncbi:hypothetical protein SG34_006975 [Thalassomonas viridans]|uniref:Lipoprotein n=1 Tax=Thalassomonas viridans TaxID=137584 RepID=A0AAF0CA98_9GAMM|nr:hypothetical protein [Thalassomonas viridans]WDE06643.1 hypothetical protein SG34_006975 [Thalassomonas viridans]
MKSKLKLLTLVSAMTSAFVFSTASQARYSCWVDGWYADCIESGAPESFCKRIAADLREEECRGTGGSR